jgi:hypothetical protein
LPLQTLGPIGYGCYRSLWNKLEKRYWKYQIKIYYVHFRPLYRLCLPSYNVTFSDQGHHVGNDIAIFRNKEQYIKTHLHHLHPNQTHGM